jgi:V-ATPase subunit C
VAEEQGCGYRSSSSSKPVKRIASLVYLLPISGRHTVKALSKGPFFSERLLHILESWPASSAVAPTKPSTWAISVPAIMPKPKYLIVSVPSSITPSGHKDDALGSIQKAVNSSYGNVSQFNVPEFKIGTLDALIQQSEELGKLEGLCNSVVAKVGDTLRNILDGDEDKIQMHKSVNDSKDAHATGLL